VYSRQGSTLRLGGFDDVVPGAAYPPPESPDYPGQPPMLEGVGLPLTWNESHGAWIIHTWPWLHNPDGMFDNFNPAVPLCECEISPTQPICN